MRFYTLLILLLSVSGCVHRLPRTLVLNYSDFGPQAVAYQTIGFEWYQWNTQGHDNPKQHDNVRVVVYDGLQLKQVQQAFPVVENILQDYRYLSLQQAMLYLDAHTQYVPSLLGTRERLASYFMFGK